ncbi:maleylacetoacetate isomerase [Photobacterium alginatilyticum]|uniref:Maleylacetoacetate isomerase n=1 Tax=Photobacterium alginatilyticum TaxID=1775171 RepID=A0ABW9YPR0_9GAMM|nr:maleylacetoacetate isomerase [Photobacterium alginatilyticum]NBI55883.1 maleylacetoacetate isomerase [Photobacterium alginatilyticum]
MKLYDYYRSSASYRVRIALNLKGLSYEHYPVSLLDNEQSSTSYTSLNPSALVPSFESDRGLLGQSIAIMEYLEDCYPEPAILPSSRWEKAKCREISLAIACDIHPLNNLRVLNYLHSEFGVHQNEKMIWYHHWLSQGFQTLETLLSDSTHHFCCGDTPTMADICLLPQIYNARRFGFDVGPYPTLQRIEQHCLHLDAFVRAHPDAQSEQGTS